MVGEETERNITVYTTPEKRRIWVTVILSFFGLGLPMIYCGRVKQGIIVEAALIAFYLISKSMMALIPRFYIFLIYVLLVTSLLIGLTVYNILLTIDSNKLKIPRLRNTWKLIVLVGLVSIAADKTVSYFVHWQIIEAYRIPATSMENALYVGDFLIATKSIKTEDIRDGDIIVFKYPGDRRYDYMGKGSNYVKRVMASGGERIKIVNKHVFVDGRPIDEPPTVIIDSSRMYPYYRDIYDFGPGNRDNMPEITVPEGKLFVMGDNRDYSSDSRFWGFVDENDVIGRARYIHFSWDSEKNRIRWERLGLRLDR